ncbi:DUF6484 domain-containing protein [Polaromonas glacialis]|uniref:DUF6484 domain-containing protein n=1 Tax=Polaromonas glacialis TaxID=866564 RepID=UPI001E572EF9|nr:DUF6484 domain-containing protein [Polaromonas glacialis]
MSEKDLTEAQATPTIPPASVTELWKVLAKRRETTPPPTAPPIGVVIGELIGITNAGCTPLVLYPGQLGTAAVLARSALGLQGGHIGRQVILMFEAGDATKPIIMGLLHAGEGSTLPDPLGQVEVDADGERLMITANEQLVLRCGKASITLTKAGKVLIRGSYLLSRSSGANRIKGGSVQIN